MGLSPLTLYFQTFHCALTLLHHLQLVSSRKLLLVLIESGCLNLLLSQALVNEEWAFSYTWDEVPVPHGHFQIFTFSPYALVAHFNHILSSTPQCCHLLVISSLENVSTWMVIFCSRCQCLLNDKQRWMTSSLSCLNLGSGAFFDEGLSVLKPSLLTWDWGISQDMGLSVLKSRVSVLDLVNTRSYFWSDVLRSHLLAWTFLPSSSSDNLSQVTSDFGSSRSISSPLPLLSPCMSSMSPLYFSNSVASISTVHFSIHQILFQAVLAHPNTGGSRGPVSPPLFLDCQVLPETVTPMPLWSPALQLHQVLNAAWRLHAFLLSTLDLHNDYFQPSPHFLNLSFHSLLAPPTCAWPSADYLSTTSKTVMWRPFSLLPTAPLQICLVLDPVVIFLFIVQEV